MSTSSLPPVPSGQATSPQVDHRVASIEPRATVDEEGEFSGGLETAPPPIAGAQWFTLGIEKSNAAMFQAACIPYRPQLGEAVRAALQDQQRTVSDIDFSVLIDCLIDVAFEAAKQSREPWADFTDADRVRWISQFAEAAIEHFDSL
jgi:hypothetical protein